jgi:hypothetical protein
MGVNGNSARADPSPTGVITEDDDLADATAHRGLLHGPGHRHRDDLSVTAIVDKRSG